MADYLLAEDNSFLLLEDGGRIILDGFEGGFVGSFASPVDEVIIVQQASDLEIIKSTEAELIIID